MPANTSHILPAIPNGISGQALVDAVNDECRQYRAHASHHRSRAEVVRRRDRLW